MPSLQERAGDLEHITPNFKAIMFSHPYTEDSVVIELAVASMSGSHLV